MNTSSHTAPSPRAAGQSKPTSSIGENRGFALIATISMLVLLALISVGLLSLSTVVVRSTSASSAQQTAQANARLALMIAIGEIQQTLGDDRRISADASILPSAAQGHAVGVWKSWSPRMTEDPDTNAPNYNQEKSDSFVKWLASANENDQKNIGWVNSAPSDSISLFGANSDGFTLQAPRVDINITNQKGSYAWVVSQENTKAKINVDGPEDRDRIANDDLQAQPRASLALTDFYEQPNGDWNRRAARVINLNQAKLDDDLATGNTPGGAHFTTSSNGLLTNVVDGGLKVDLSLGFEMAKGDFEAENWADAGETIANPFHANGEDDFIVPRDYDDQRPLYRPLTEKGTKSIRESFWPANVQFDFPVTSVPTFHSLRSFYRMPYHLYRTKGETEGGAEDQITVFERPNDHIAGAPGALRRSFFRPASTSVDGAETQLGIRPVMDRVMFLISAALADNNELRMNLTPLVTLWNPYNVALEIEGAVAHTWLDLPYELQWTKLNANGRPIRDGSVTMPTSRLLGYQFINKDHGRSVDPYFFAAITATGAPISESGSNPTIRFEPGEVRVFTPADTRPKTFKVDGSVRERTVFMKPVDDISDYNTTGGFSIPTRNDPRGEGARLFLEPGGKARFQFSAVRDNSGAEDYPFYISLEDATRAKGSNPTNDENDKGQAIADVLTRSFTSKNGDEDTENFLSPPLTYATLKKASFPVGAIESYHRVARSGVDGQDADLVFTGNPRQPWMNPFITETAFKTGPQYVNRMRAMTSFNDVIQTGNGGRSAFYGPSHSRDSGRSRLSFFEIPSAPPLSLAAFQHGDFSSTPFAPANQIGNSWASAYVSRDKASEDELNVDHCYLLNESLWDGYFFSGAAPEISYSERNQGDSSVWNQPIANINRSVSNVLLDFFKPWNSGDSPPSLRNPRMRKAGSVSDPQALANSLSQPAGAVKIAGELMVDGAFNVNSTSEEAWAAMLASLRGASFTVEQNRVGTGNETAFPRFRDPVGITNDQWNGFRTLSDQDIKKLATELVIEVKKRGPFLSLGEFINRRISSGGLGLKGAIQAAIDQAGLNATALADGEKIDTNKYDSSGRENITPNNTQVGTPGYLTQADLLKPLASVITVRSDTFIVRAYGDARDASGNILAKAYAEATVQRVPDFVEPSDLPHKSIDALSSINENFGRKIRIVSFRYLKETEIF